jgi:large subunit ribosomal protein L18
MKKRKIIGSQERPRLSVYRSLTNIYAQVIDDRTGRTLASASSLTLAGPPAGRAGKGKKKLSKTEQAKAVGMNVAAAAKTAGVEKVVFDRGRFLYRGRIRILADSAREGGLKF